MPNEWFQPHLVELELLFFIAKPYLPIYMGPDNTSCGIHSALYMLVGEATWLDSKPCLCRVTYWQS